MSEQDKLTITKAAVDRLGDCEDARFKQIMTALIHHLHDFVREVELTEKEWFKAIQFLTDTGKACVGQRQEFILLSDTLGVSMLVVMLAQAKAAGEGRVATRSTEATIQGPFFWEGAPSLPLGSDISNGVSGEPTLYRGRVGDPEGRAVAGALIDVWSVDGGGYYDMQTSSEMRARAKFRSDEAGRYWFWSIRPRHYPIPTDGPVGAMLEAMGRHCYRPAHMHLAVRAEGYVPLTTQLFDAQSEFLDSDAVFGVRDSLIVEFQKHAPGAAADGRALSVPYYTVDFDLRLAPEKPRRSLAAAQRAELA